MVHNTIALQISMLNVWLVGWRIVWMVGWVTEWLIGWLGDGLAAQHDWLADQLAEWLAGGLMVWLAGWLNGGLAGWLADWLPDWLAVCKPYQFSSIELFKSIQVWFYWSGVRGANQLTWGWIRGEQIRALSAPGVAKAEFIGVSLIWRRKSWERTINLRRSRGAERAVRFHVPMSLSETKAVEQNVCGDPMGRIQCSL